jgi:alpha-L-rhamnosidase
MKKDKIIRGMVMVFLCSVNICGLKAQEKAGECVPTDLKCEHLVAPLGIDRQAPRFSWHLEDSRGGAVQTAYRITVGKDSVALSKGKKILWQEKKAGLSVWKSR